ncbi:glycosyltransferase family 2 protein [Streptococcus downei]|uniref:Glycosyltransferase n=1 Tax=Streptococcus downei MFe28 TaxID=764290 RepID=A0A380JF73_STRDO|nr:glycosyltransferase [Streptococcus downei]SUN36047.1 glycosyltransferase [Streptococcus downei MFe28]
MPSMMVSIICTSYNYADFIGTAIESFLAQEFDFPYEIILVDDCSTDKSREIIASYAKSHPDLIRVFLNEKNKGITRTWIDICKEARGKYIARCDADDYWIDSKKLQKQVDLLEANPDSKWCNTSFNIVDENNQVTAEDVFKNGPIAYANTYEKMLATKGMTLPSSWLVETDLMQTINDNIDKQAVDDTFNVQLELFEKTSLSFLPEPTVAYRMTSNSDSRPQSEEKMIHRIDGLLKTQLDYLKKYPDQDMAEMTDILVRQDAKQEKRIYYLSREIHQQRDEIAQLNEEVQNTHSLLNQEVNSSLKAHKLLEEEQAEKSYWQSEYQKVIHSKRWTIPTKIINFFRRK